MPNCKTCGTKYSFWTGRGDHLCKACGAQADADAKREKERKEAERKQRVFDDSRDNIAWIVEALAGEQPLSFTFVNRNITTQQQGGGNGLLGFVVGGVVGGAIGGIGSALASGATSGGGTSSHSGELGILVVTPTQVLVGCFASSFLSADGRISSDHLTKFCEQLKSAKLVRKTFNIRQTQLVRTPEKEGTVTLKIGLEEFSYRKSDLYVNDAPYPLPSAHEIRSKIEELGPLVTPAEFIAMLQRGENPIPEDQVMEMPKDDKYFAQVFALIVNHPERDSLLKNFSCLVPPLRQLLEARIKSKGSSVGRVKRRLLVCVMLAIAGAIGIAMTDEFLCFLCFVLTATTVIVSLVSVASLRRAIWCRDILGDFAA